MKIAILSASPRTGSNTVRFARFVQHLLQESGAHEVTLVDFAGYDLPMVGSGTLLPEALTPFQQELIAAWAAADLLFVASPEYNWTASPQILNTLHHIATPAFRHLLDGKVFAVAGTSSGRGGRQPALDMITVLNKVISFTNSLSIVSPKLYESHETDKNLDPDGTFIGHELYDHTVRAFIDYTLSVAQRWQTPVEAA